MITIFHNPRCSKSRQALELVKQSGKDFQVRDYLKEPLSEGELRSILQALNMAPIELVRTNEKIWKENYRDKDLNEEEVIRIMTQNPSLIQRPVVQKEESAVVGRPTEKIEDLLK